MNSRFLSLVIAGLLLSGCGSTISDSALEATGLKGAPKWVINGGEGLYSGIGDAPIIKNNVQFARTEALAAARAEIAKQIEVRINTYLQKITQRKDESLSEDARSEIREITKLDLIDSNLSAFWISDDGSRAYVLVKLSQKAIAEIRKKLKSQKIDIADLELSTQEADQKAN